jgi:predicted CopG family antitoxin
VSREAARAADDLKQLKVMGAQGRPSVSGVITELVELHREDLKKERD